MRSIWDDFGDALDKKPEDPRLTWRLTARPEQLLPATDGSWRVFYLQGGRGSGKTRAGAQALADLVLSDTAIEGEYAIVAPTYADAWTKCVEGESGILKALGTSMAEIKDHRSKTVRSAWRTYGQVILHSGIVIYADSAAEGGLRIQGRNLRAAWCLRGKELVATIHGDVPIRDVSPGDLVMTRRGWRKVTGQALTRRDAPLVRVTASDGKTIECTPDHPVWTRLGWVDAGCLQIGDTLSVWSNSSQGRQLGMTGVDSAGTERTAATTSMTTARGSVCTSPFGRGTTGRSPLARSSITMTTTGVTTSPITSRPSPGPGITSTISVVQSETLGSGNGSAPGHLPLSLRGSRECSPARTKTAVSSSRHEVPSRRSGSAQRTAPKLPVVVTSVEPCGTDDVYDISVDGAHEFYANGILVHNCDEVGLWDKWDTTWNESLKYAVRQGVSVVIATGTPKASRPARALVRRLIRNDPAEGGVIVRKLRTVDNVANLSSAFYRSVVGAAKGTRLERQELEGELLEDVANALWTRDQLDAIQVPMVGQEGGPAYLHQAVIGVDPSDGAESSDEQAYTIAGMYLGMLYVAKNWGGQEPPAAFARRVILEAVAWHAKIVVEKNHGGRWLTTVFAQVMEALDKEGHIPDGRRPYVEVVDAHKSKRTRAEPVSALYERGVVRHCYDGETYEIADPETGAKKWHRDIVKLAELEDQMATFTGAKDERSPDRLDSMVWACHSFLRATFEEKPMKAQHHQWAAQAEIEAEAGTDNPANGISRRRLKGAHGGMLDHAGGGWDLADFAPHADDAPVNPGPRANQHTWR